MNKILVGDCFDLTKLKLPMFDMIIADPAIKCGIEKHEKWINEVMKYLKIRGVLCIVGHRNQNLFQTPNKSFKFLCIKKDSDKIMKFNKSPYYVDGEVNDVPDNVFVHDTDSPSYLCISKLIKDFSNKGDLVMDAFAGKGTISKACKSLKRGSIGIEKDPQKVKKVSEVLKWEYW